MKRKIEKLIDNRRYIGGKVLGTLGFCTSCAVDLHGEGPEWLEVVDINLRLPNLPEQFRGKRIIHISDLHYSRTVSRRYLHNCIEKINQLDPDIVLLTGDYVTHDFNGRYRKRVVDLLGRIRFRYGMYACLGNHDYGNAGLFGRTKDELLDEMVKGMENEGVNILRNESTTLEINDTPLWLVGLGDMWVDDFHPHKAFANVPEDQAVITLMHNPDGVNHLHDYPAHTMLSGHTHGVRNVIASAGSLPFNTRQYHAGMYNVKGRNLYVNRGLGRLGRIRFNNRPEITVCTLQ